MRLAAIVALPLCFVSCRKAEPLAVYKTVPNFTLTAQNGKPFESDKELKGKIWVADFIYTTCPGPCPRMSRQMKQVERALHELADIRIVSFTVDPENDTPAVLAEYAKEYGADESRWFFLTGEKAALQKLSFEAFMLGTISGNLDHSTRFVLVDRIGRVRKYYDTSEAESIPTLIADAKALAHEPPGN